MCVIHIHIYTFIYPLIYFHSKNNIVPLYKYSFLVLLIHILIISPNMSIHSDINNYLR